MLKFLKKMQEYFTLDRKFISSVNKDIEKTEEEIKRFREEYEWCKEQNDRMARIYDAESYEEWEHNAEQNFDGLLAYFAEHVKKDG